MNQQAALLSINLF